MNISRDVQPLSILAEVYKLYQCCHGVQPLAMLVGVYNMINFIKGEQPLWMLSECTIFINIIRVYNLYQYYHGGHCLPHIQLIKVITHPNGIEISNKHDIIHPCNYILTLLHTPGVINKSDYSCLMTLMNMIAHLW